MTAEIMNWKCKAPTRQTSDLTNYPRETPMPFVVSLLVIVAGFVLSLTDVRPAAADDVVIRPQPKPGALDNPLKGWCPYTNAGEIYQPYSMVFQYVSWRELEPVEGEFRFEEWEKTWNIERAKGKHVIFRVYVDYPSLPSGLPEWLRRAGVKVTAYSDHGGGHSPDYNDPRMVAGMERLITALGKRYNKHPRIAFVQLGLLGFWGEWHTWPQEHLYASPETERRIIDAYKASFPDKSLLVRYARGYAGEQPWIGFHDDMFPQDTDNGKDWSFLAGLRRARRTENWKVAVVGGEMEPSKARHWVGERFEATQTMLERSHFTWIGPYGPALERPNDATFRMRSEALVRRMGYDFQITELVHPAEMKTRQPATLVLKATNLGMAPFYYPWSVEWALLDSSGALVNLRKTDWDIRQWKPGAFTENVTLTWDAPPGVYRLGLGIRDPWRDRPAIHFANDLPVVNGWTILSVIRMRP
jgi:hypothetical protein